MVKADGIRGENTIMGVEGFPNCFVMKS